MEEGWRRVCFVFLKMEERVCFDLGVESESDFESEFEVDETKEKEDLEVMELYEDVVEGLSRRGTWADEVGSVWAFRSDWSWIIWLRGVSDSQLLGVGLDIVVGV